MNEPLSRDPRHHLLSPSELAKLFALHVQPLLEARQRSSRGTVVAVMGPAASGKTTLARVFPARLGVPDPFIVDADDFIPLHPSFQGLRDRFGEAEARNILGPTEIADELFARTLDHAFEKGNNLAIAGPMTNPEWVAEHFSRWRDSHGAHIHAVALAVHEARSLLSTVDRFRQQVEATGHGRWVGSRWHDLHYTGILQSLQRIETDGLADSVHCVARGGRAVYSNVLASTDPVVAWRHPPAAAAAVRTERSRLWTDREHADFHRRGQAIERFARAGGLEPQQAQVAADAIRRGLPPNDRAVVALRTHAVRTTDQAAASNLVQRARQRARHNRELAAAADHLASLAGSQSVSPTTHARIAALGRPASANSLGSSSRTVDPGVTSRPPGRPLGPGPESSFGR